MKKGRVDVEKIPLSFLRDVRRVKGTLEQILTHAQPSEDYMHVVLTDDTPLTLSLIHIVLARRDG